MCIICFLEDTFQYKLRKSAQLKTDRFEHSLIEYKLLFLDGFINNKLDICDNHNTQNNNLIRESLSEIDVKEIDIFFDDLYDSYLYWIDSKPVLAMDKINSLLTTKNMEVNNICLPNLTYFRGRCDSNFISHWDMFHIPYNKRYLINNQRYSLVGQPLLYLCTSPYCVIKELNTTEKVKISSFRLNNFDDNNIKLFDNTNPFIELINKNNDTGIIKQTNSLLMDNEFIKKENFKVYFYKLILSSCCSFEINNKQENSHFIEEYILPQLLSQILKERGLKGIIYTSTKSFNDKIINMNYNLFIKFYKNYCLFTDYSKEKSYDQTYVYDRELYNRFNISTPLNWDSKFEDDYCNINDSIEYINNRIFNIDYIDINDLNLIHDINESLIIYADFIKSLLNDKNKLNKQMNYDKSRNMEITNLIKSIKLHNLFLRNIIVSINEKYFFKEDFKCLKRK